MTGESEEDEYFFNTCYVSKLINFGILAGIAGSCVPLHDSAALLKVPPLVNPYITISIGNERVRSRTYVQARECGRYVAAVTIDAIDRVIEA
jgi:hypothetical protein